MCDENQKIKKRSSVNPHAGRCTVTFSDLRGQISNLVEYFFLKKRNVILINDKFVAVLFYKSLDIWLMKNKKQKRLILSLIKDDLINSKLVNSLYDAGLDPNNYTLNLSDTIFKLVGIKHTPTNEFIYKNYLELIKKVKHINISQEQNGIDSLVEEMYSYLLYEKSKLYG